MAHRVVSLFNKVLGSLLLGMGFLGFAGPSYGEQPKKPNQASELWELLLNVQENAKTLNYEGTIVLRTDNQTQTSQIRHLHGPDGEFEVLERLDGQPSKWLRHNDQIQCIIPDRKMILSQQRNVPLAFPRFLLTNEGDNSLSRYYDIQELPAERVAGREARAISLNPKDTLRYPYRLFLDRDTSLVLKTELYGLDGELLERVGFTEISFEASTTQMPEIVTAGPDWMETKQFSKPVEVAHLNFQLPDPLKGFNKIQSLCRVKEELNKPVEVHQVMYSDGMSSVSVFVRKHSEAVRLPSGLFRQGAVSSRSAVIGEHHVTVLGEVPESMIDLFINSIEWK